MTKEIIVGLVGQHSSGKGTVAETLEKEFGFFATSLSDRIREEVRGRGMTVERENLRIVGNELRERYGSAVLVERTREIVEAGGYEKVVIDSVRNPAEIEAIRALGGLIVGVLATPEKRLELMVERGRPGDAKNMEELIELDEKENKADGGDHVQKVEECLKLADMYIKNEGTLEDLQKKIREELAPQLAL